MPKPSARVPKNQKSIRDLMDKLKALAKTESPETPGLIQEFRDFFERKCRGIVT